jgi:hypothetical protein
VKKRYRSTSIIHLTPDIIIPFAINGIEGLMKALTLGTKKNSSTITEDMLLVIQVWFRFGHISEV